MGPELTMRVTAANSICWASIKTSASNSKMKPALRSPKMVPVLPHPGANWHEVVEARDPARAEEISIPFRLTLSGMLQFAIKPMWGLNYVTHESFKLPQLDEHVDISGGAMSIGRYFTEMLDPSMNWDDVAEMVRLWNGQFCLKGIMSVADAKRAVEIGCTGIIVSNHGGRQLDGSRAPFDQLSEIVDAVADRIDVLMDGGIQRGTHVLKALSLGAKAVGVGRFYLFPLAAAGQAGVERALGLMRAEIERGMKLMGCTAIGQLSRDNLRFR
jgi:L-lactate dehydrogenase (cytochrome)